MSLLNVTPPFRGLALDCCRLLGGGVPGLGEFCPNKVAVQRDVWVSVRTEQSHLSRIKAATQFLKQIFARDAIPAGQDEQIADPLVRRRSDLVMRCRKDPIRWD